METTIQIIGIVAAVTTMLSWLLRTIINHFINRSNAKDKYIENLVAQNQENVENFINAINHNQSKINHSIDRLASNINVQTEVFKQLIKNK